MGHSIVLHIHNVRKQSRKDIIKLYYFICAGSLNKLCKKDELYPK